MTASPSDTDAPFLWMQRAVDIVLSSPHPSSKIAACVFGSGPDGQAYTVSSTNFWPDRIQAAFPNDARIGNSSGTVHAETACLLKAPKTDGGAICITDPFCPNCAKNIAEAGIKTIYIDHKGFEKEFIQRRGSHFEDMSLEIARKAGLSVYRIFRKSARIEAIIEPAKDYQPVDVMPPVIQKIENLEDLKDWSLRQPQSQSGHGYASAFARDYRGHIYGILALAHPVIGLDEEKAKTQKEVYGGKYSFWLEPVNRLLMTAKRNGLWYQTKIFTSQTPTARELVNLSATQVETIEILDPKRARDKDCYTARDSLAEKGVFKFL